MIDGLSHAYQAPQNPKGLVVFLHGCSRSIYDGWPQSYPKFLGFPQDVGRTKQALRAGYAILYVSPHNQQTNCFSAKEGKDPQTTKKVIDQIRATLKLQSKPLYLGGCSAGGGMIQRLVANGSIQCDGMFNESATSGEPSAKTPPSLWTVLATAKELQAAQGRVATLRKFGKPAGVLISPKQKITPTFFADQMASVSMDSSAQITASLASSGLINASGDILRDPKDPSHRQWFLTLQKTVKIPETKNTFWNSGIVEAILNAYGVHEACSMYMTTFLKWAESGFKGNTQQLGAQYAVTKPAYVLV
jgi:hypothetical protein